MVASRSPTSRARTAPTSTARRSAAVNVARKLDVDPELELRAAARRFRERVEAAERLAADRGEDWSALPLSEQDSYFDQAKEIR